MNVGGTHYINRCLMLFRELQQEIVTNTHAHSESPLYSTNAIKEIANDVIDYNPYEQPKRIKGTIIDEMV